MSVFVNCAFRAIVNKLFYESFDITFMRNRKNCQNIYILFHKFFLKMIHQQMPLAIRASVNIFHTCFTLCSSIKFQLFDCIEHESESSFLLKWDAEEDWERQHGELSLN